NVRLSYMDSGAGVQVIEENNYYPFGLKHEGYNGLTGNPSYQYKYNGKELQTETGMYDYGARFYMPDIGRWGVVDPLAEKYRRHSTYAYAVNNPIRFIDPDGMQVWPPEGGSDGQTWSDSDGDFVNMNGTWYKDDGALMGFLSGSRYQSVNTKNAGGTPGYDGKAMLPDSSYDYTYDLMPGKQADDVNYWKNGESGLMASRFLETTGRDATAVENRTTTIEAVTIVATTGKAGKGSPTIKEQALGIKSNLNSGRNSVKIKTVSGETRYDLDGATHKGVETPHVQTSTYNKNPKTGEVFLNKNNKDVRPMNQQDIRTVKKVIEQRKAN
uniref:RHS repeat-associated core domain-containing protein n=1 Tax=uncultured Chryseobacterium sp. TaxID=259322 RepID=UPI0025E1570D